MAPVAADIEHVIEDGMHAAGRAVKDAQRRAEDLGADLKDETARCVKQQPLQAVAVAFGAGIAIGTMVGWLAHRPARG